MSSTKERARKQEEHVASIVDGRVVPNSGGGRFSKGDVENELMLYECKTSMTKKKSISIQESWLDDIKAEAFMSGKTMAATAFDFGRDGKHERFGETYFIIDTNTMELFLELYRAEYGHE